MTDDPGLKRVLARIPAARLSRELGLHRTAVGQWQRVPADRVTQVARLSGVPAPLIRPDLYPPDVLDAVRRDGALS